jgi:hypothetical protein
MWNAAIPSGKRDWVKRGVAGVSSREKRRTIIRWQHLLNREHPTGTERKIAHTRVRMEGWRQRRLGWTEKTEKLKKERYSLLTRTGLLMEGLSDAGP